MRNFSETKILKKTLAWVLVATFVMSAIGMNPGKVETVEAVEIEETDFSIPTASTEETGESEAIKGTLGWISTGSKQVTIETQEGMGVKVNAPAASAYSDGITTQAGAARYKISEGFRLEFNNFQSDDDNYSVAVMLGYKSSGQMAQDGAGYAFLYGKSGNFAILKTGSGFPNNVVTCTSGLTPLSEIDVMSLYVKCVANGTTYDWKVIINNGEFEYTIADVKAATSYYDSCNVGLYIYNDFVVDNVTNVISGLKYYGKRGEKTSFNLSKTYFADATGKHADYSCLGTWFKISYAPVESVIISKENISVERKGTVSLSTTVIPETANDSGIIWSSSNNKIATVDQNGVVTGLARGQATITATTTYGKAVSCPVTVYEAKIDTGNGQVLINAGEQLPINDYAYSQDANHDGVYITDWKLNGEALTDFTYYSNNAGKYTAEYVNLDMLHIHAQKNKVQAGVYRFIGSVDAPIAYKESGFVIAKTQDAKIGDSGVHVWSNTDIYYTGIVLGDDRIVSGDTGLFDVNIYGEEFVNNKLFIRAFKFNSVSEENPYYVRAYVKLADGTVVYGKTITFMGDVHFE